MREGEREREREIGRQRDSERGREGGRERESARRMDFSEKNKNRQTTTSTQEFFTFHKDAVCLN